MQLNDEFKVIIRNAYKHADFTQKQRFKSSGDVKTDVSVLAKAHMERCEKEGTKLVSDVKKFRQFKQVRDSSGNLTYSETIGRAKSMQSTFATYGIFTIDAIGGVNSLFRNILLFKQVNFAQIEADLAAFNTNIRQHKVFKVEGLIAALRAIKNPTKANGQQLRKLNQLKTYWLNCKPFADYNVRVTVEHDYNCSNKAGQSADAIKVFKVNTIRVKRLIYSPDGVVLGALFDSRSCQPVNAWLKSFTFNI